jgi:hypothetical protein
MAVVSAVSQESSVAAGQVESRCAAQLEVGEQLIKLSAKMKQVSGKLELHMSNFRI